MDTALQFKIEINLRAFFLFACQRSVTHAGMRERKFHSGRRIACLEALAHAAWETMNFPTRRWPPHTVLRDGSAHERVRSCV
jgi:hypothetical protein